MEENWHSNISNKNREEIISAGKKVFVGSNFLNVKITDICTLAGVSRVTFYKNFNTIDELIFEVQMDILNKIAQFIKDKSDFTGNGKEDVKTVLYAWIDFAKEHKEEMKFIVFFDLYYSSYDLNEELKLKYNKFTHEDYNRSLLKSALAKGVKDESLKKDLDTSKTGMYIYQAFMGLLQRMSYATVTKEFEYITLDEVCAKVIEVIISSIENRNY
jgi:AcrR family transcriptional regulator